MRGFRELDRVLRGAAAPAPGETALPIPLGPLCAVNAALAALYGVCMGFFGVFGRVEPDFRFLLADAVKVPLLLLLTLVVTFPSLYVFNALVGSRLGALDLARLMAATIGVLVAVLAAFGPIVAFFSVTTTSYPFIVILNVVVFTVAAGFAVTFLLRTADKLTTPLPTPPSPAPAEARVPEGALPPVVATLEEPAPSGSEPRERRRRAEPAPKPPEPDPKVRAVLWGWLVVFALVGAQMSWVLRPFIGTPQKEFTWFRPRDGSFFEGVMKALGALLSR